MQLERVRSHTPTLGEIHQQLKALYSQEYPDGAPKLYEALLQKLPIYIGAIVRRKLDLLVTAELGPERGHQNLNGDEKNALSMFLDPQVLRAFLEVGRDSALSNGQHTIAHFDTQPPIVANELISIAAGEHQEYLLQMGCVFFDVDGTKTIVDCTSHSHAGKYLEALAEFLCKLPDPVQTWLRDRNLQTEAFTVAGDEFIVMLRSRNAAVTQSTLDEFATVVQQAIATDANLASFVSFDDPEFVMEYDEWTDAEKRAYNSNPESMKAKFTASRAKLPDRFVPSVSSGSALFIEALSEALSPDTETATTLEELGINAFRIMAGAADQRMKESKRAFRETMTDPTWKAFLLRNSENRRLQREIDELRALLAKAQLVIHRDNTAPAEPRGEEGEGVKNPGMIE